MKEMQQESFEDSGPCRKIMQVFLNLILMTSNQPKTKTSPFGMNLPKIEHAITSRNCLKSQPKNYNKY